MSNEKLNLCADVAFVGYAAAKKKIEQLEARNAELEKEVERLKAEIKRLDEAQLAAAQEEISALHTEIDDCHRRLAIAEEHTLRMREAFNDMLAWTRGKHSVESLNRNSDLLGECDTVRITGLKIVAEALAHPTDTSALDAFVAEKVKEETYELTKQRDLAVDALENCRLLAARYRNDEWASHIMRFCKDAGLSGSPLRNEAIKESEVK